MLEIRYIIVEESRESVKAWEVIGYREAMTELKKLKAEHPENIYRVAMQ